MRHEKTAPWEISELNRRGLSERRPDVDEVFQTGTKKSTVNPLNRRKGMVISAVLVVIMAVLGARLVYLQSGKGDLYRVVVDQNRYRYISTPAPRGAILDMAGRELAKNVPDFSLTVIPAAMPEKEADYKKYMSKLITVSGLTENKIIELVGNKKYGYNDQVPILEHIQYEKALKLTVQVSDLPGVQVLAVPTRQYVYGQATAHILGYIGKVTKEERAKDKNLKMIDVIGKTGIEYMYNGELTGEDGYIAYERDTENSYKDIAKTVEANEGNTVKLTIDAKLQEKLFSVLQAKMKAVGSKGAAAVAIDPRNGEIRAMVSLPTYDSNWFVSNGHEEEKQNALTSDDKYFVNRAVKGVYPSGSLIKPLIAVAALAEKVVTPQTTVMSVGGFKVGNNFFPDWKAGGHGLTNLAKAIAESVNTYFYAVGGGYKDQQGLGVDRIVKYLQLFGLGKKTGVDLPSESAGLVPTKEWREEQRPSPWRLGDTYHLSIGQGDLEVTPLQMATAMAAIANGGTLYEPHLLKEIIAADGTVVKKQEAKVVRNNIASLGNFKDVQAGMREGVLNGSSRSMQDLPVAVAGKTGTAQYGSAGKTHSWYTAYGPYNDPELVITVIIEGGGEGNAAALPVAHEVLKWYFSQ